MMEKLETLGNQLLIQGVIGGTAVTALTGALAGTLAIGGVLMGGGLALAELVALVAIAAIGYAIANKKGFPEGKRRYNMELNNSEGRKWQDHIVRILGNAF